MVRALGDEQSSRREPAEDQIANLDSGGQDQAYFIHAKVNDQGLITVTNSRNDYQQTYQSR